MGPARLVQKCFDCSAVFLDKWAAREGDTGRQILEKRVCIVFVTTLAVMSVAAYGNKSEGSTLDYYSPIIFTPIYVLLLLYLRLKREASTYFIAVTCTVFMIGLMLHDMSEAAESNRRNWPFAIILVDLLLVIRAPSALTLGIVNIMCVYLTVIQAEETWRFGLFDLSILAPYEDRFCQGDCDKPPCPRLVASSVLMSVTNLFLFLLDFYFTRGFALQVRREKEKI
eukprot:Rhum_TRINITY_DN13920_c1_g1::Rhum_TRINITY_DN13920_c1_g1_i1::g.65833::m.65833